MNKILFKSVIVVAMSAAMGGKAMADGLADLKNALANLKGNSPVTAQITNVFEQARGEGDEIVVKKGYVQVKASDDINGLQVFYDAQTLRLMDEESLAKAEDEDAPTPTLMGLNNNLGTMDMRLKFSSAAHLEKRISQSTFVSEKEIEHEGKTLRKLTFDMPMEAIITDKTTRGYVDKFDASYTIIIDANGNPVESELNFNGKGRAYIVLSVKAEVFSKSTYQVLNDRLLQMTNSYGGNFKSSLWPDSSYQGGHEMQLTQSSEMLSNVN